MRLNTFCSCLLIVFLASSGTSAGICFNVDVFVDVILGVRKFYSMASVIFTYPGDKYGNNEDLQITHLIHTSSRLLSRRYITTADVNFKKLGRSLKYYNQIIQPVTIVIIPDFEAYVEFAESTKTYPMSFPVWLVLFFYTPDNNTHDHCRNPIDNPFNVAFDTQMLVLCHNETILREWYSIKGDTVKIFDLAEWKGDEGFVLLTNLSLYNRRNNMEGVVLRGVSIKDSILTNFDGNYVGNMYMKMLEELKSTLNFTLKIVSQKNEYGVWNRRTRTWSGAMGEIVSGNADFAMADMSMTSFRMQYVDFTLPLIISKTCLYIREPEVCGVQWLGYFQTFNSYTWATIITLIAIAPLLLSFMSRESRNIMDLISENFICIWGIFCQQGLIEFPKSSSLRVAYFTIFLTAVLIMVHYSAALVSFLTTCIGVLPFHTIDQFVEDGTYKLIIARGTANYDDISFQAKYETKSLSVKMMKLMKDEKDLPNNLIDGFEQVCKERNLAYMAMNSLKNSVEMKIPCKLLSITTGRIDNSAMILSKNNPYIGLINHQLQKFLDNGIMRRLRDTKFLPRLIEDKIYEPVSLLNIIPILGILCGGFIISITVLIVEKIYYLTRRRKSRIFYPSRKLFIKKQNNIYN